MCIRDRVFEGDDNPLKAEDAGLTAPGTGPEVNESKTAVTGSSGALDGYKLEDTSVSVSYTHQMRIRDRYGSSTCTGNVRN